PNINIRLLERTEATNKETPGKGQKFLIWEVPVLTWSGRFSGYENKATAQRPANVESAFADDGRQAAIRYSWQSISHERRGQYT
ncbi:hypothetical protein HispidOSU_012441, partial [Sigmodon hispidus]